MKISNEILYSIHEKWIDTDSRQIWIQGIDTNGPGYEGDEPGVEYMMATRTIKNLHILRKLSESEPVVVHLHTCGGDYCEGMAIYDTIKSMPYHVTMVSYTHARSMSSIILQAADERIMMPHSYFMFHWGTLATEGHAVAVRSEIAFSKLEDETMINIYVEAADGSPKFKDKKTHQIKKTIKDTMNRKGDVFLTPEETIQWGFADKIFESWK